LNRQIHQFEDHLEEARAKQNANLERNSPASGESEGEGTVNAVQKDDIRRLEEELEEARKGKDKRRRKSILDRQSVSGISLELDVAIAMCKYDKKKHFASLPSLTDGKSKKPTESRQVRTMAKERHR
jgi:hypothetical protein